MYEQYSFTYLLNRMLDRVPNTVDKREGSIIYDALSPAAWELAEMYRELDVNMNLSFADTTSGEYLTRRVAEFGINRLPATKARRLGKFYGNSDSIFDVPIGSRFSIGEINYIVVERQSAGHFVLECETAGIVGNQLFGPILPIEYINGLVRAELADVLTPGQDEESDDALRERYFEAVNEPSFGGNTSDYKRKISEIPGVGGVKVFPVWQGGGTVKCTIISATWDQPSPTLIDDIQTVIDPVANSGKGNGMAPIGHKVTIASVTSVNIDVRTNITLESGMTIGQVQGEIESAVAAYLLELRQDWKNQTQIIVRTAHIDARILAVPGVEDVNDTLINGAVANITLGQEEIPLLGTVIVND